MERLIFHIDVNNAFLSWTAVDMLKNGAKLDIRTIPAIIGGDESQRHGVVLAKSNIAKQFGSTVDDIVRTNGVEDENLIMPGEKLYIPKYVKTPASVQ